MEGNPPSPPQTEEDVTGEEQLDAGDAIEIIELEEGDGLDEGVGDLDLQDGLNDEVGEYNNGQDACDEDEIQVNDDMEIEDDSQLSLQRHSGSVFCVSLNPIDETLAISGRSTLNKQGGARISLTGG